ncbi:hypothetical protein [Latilactobacillus fragifolii]|nr:hypothetical protein [Latilactobacillus fragifolii]
MYNEYNNRENERNIELKGKPDIARQKSEMDNMAKLYSNYKELYTVNSSNKHSKISDSEFRKYKSNVDMSTSKLLMDLNKDYPNLKYNSKVYFNIKKGLVINNSEKKVILSTLGKDRPKQSKILYAYVSAMAQWIKFNEDFGNKYFETTESNKLKKQKVFDEGGHDITNTKFGKYLQSQNHGQLIVGTTDGVRKVTDENGTVVTTPQDVAMEKSLNLLQTAMENYTGS